MPTACRDFRCSIRPAGGKCPTDGHLGMVTFCTHELTLPSQNTELTHQFHLCSCASLPIAPVEEPLAKSSSDPCASQPAHGGASSSYGLRRRRKRAADRRRAIPSCGNPCDRLAPPALPPIKQISNDPASPAPTRGSVRHALAIAKGVPRLSAAQSHVPLRSPAFGAVPSAAPLGAMPSGVIVGDSWWVSGRSRSVRSSDLVKWPTTVRRPSAPAEVAAFAVWKGREHEAGSAGRPF
jgi:hypothetical protein